MESLEYIKYDRVKILLTLYLSYIKKFFLQRIQFKSYAFYNFGLKLTCSEVKSLF